MDVKNLKDLSKIADICRKKGIETIKISADSVEFKLKDLPIKPTKRELSAVPDLNTEDKQAISDEDVLFWSAGSTEGAPS